MKPTLYPGWKMTEAQHRLYFNLLAQVYAAGNLTTAADKEMQRKLIHQRAFGRAVSAKDIDRMKMFDAFVAECNTWLKPADLNTQLKSVDQPLNRLRHRILQFPRAYVLALLQSPRFQRHSLADLDAMNEVELTYLRNTLCARLPDHAKAQRNAEEPVAEPLPF